MKTVKTAGLRAGYKREDLGKGTRVKYFKKYQKGTNLVLLSPDVAAVFHDDASVNDALRDLIRVANQSVSPVTRPGHNEKSGR
ncbi:MAG: hypothetical protein HY751_01245 [Nitrospinae bacterium]|nr:hypothetical protein [Nitrospinota bacterium]